MQIAPSKLDAERVFPISPELAHVLAQIIDRVRGTDGTIPACSRFDTRERIYGPPLPHLFQRPIGSGHQVFSPETVRKWLERTLARAPLHDTDGTPLRFTPHDFRRLFATGAVNTGLPIHIAAALLGHRNLNTTQGYTAVYPEEVIRTYQAFIHTRHAERPTKEYREPSEAEWAEFERHFTLRKVAYGNCDRPYGTPCAPRTRPVDRNSWGRLQPIPTSTDSDFGPVNAAVQRRMSLRVAASRGGPVVLRVPPGDARSAAGQPVSQGQGR